MNDPGQHDDRRIRTHENQQDSHVKARQDILFEQFGQEHGGQGKIQQVVVEYLSRIELEKAKSPSQVAEHDDDKEGCNDPNQLKQSLNP